METLRARIRELLAENPDLNQTALARNIKTDPSTISKFLSGERPINDITLLARMARQFDVSVGYLIGETSRKRDAKIAAIVTICEDLTEPSLDGLIVIAKTLPKEPLADAPTAGGSSPVPPAPRRNNGRKPPKGRKPR